MRCIPRDRYGGAAVGDHDVAFPIGSTFRNPSTPYLSDVDAGRYLAGDTNAYARFCTGGPDLRTRRGDARAVFPLASGSPVTRGNSRNAVQGRVFVAEHGVGIEARSPARRSGSGGHDLSARNRRAGSGPGAGCAPRHRLHRRRCVRVEKPRGAQRARGCERSSRKTASEQTLQSWKDHLKDARFALFVGSGHPPNADGFWTMFAPSLAFLAPDQCVIAVGGVGTLLPRHETFQRWDQINASRLRCAGMLEDESLAALLALAACVVLPIAGGGGSNIKTAEALINARLVIGTSASFRGYTGVDRLQGVHRADEPLQFRRLVKAALDGELAGCNAGNPDRDAFLWTSTLARVSMALESAQAAAHERKADRDPDATLA